MTWKLGLPPVHIKEGLKPNARHRLTHIAVRPAGPTIVGSLAQDKWEWAFLRLVGLPFLLIPAAIILFLAARQNGGFGALEWHAYYLAFVPSLVLYVYGPRWWPGLIRYMELNGHMREAVIARDYYGERLIPYVRKEAEVLVRRYDDFRLKNAGFDQAAYHAIFNAEVDHVAAEMIQYQESAERWAARNGWRIRRWMKWFSKET